MGAYGVDGQPSGEFNALPPEVRVRAQQLADAGMPFHIVDGQLVEGESAGLRQPVPQGQPWTSINDYGGGHPDARPAARRPSAAEDAAAAESARRQVELQYADAEAEAAARRERMVADAKAASERAAALPKLRMSMEQGRVRAERVDTLVDEILPRIDGWTAGWIGGKLSEWGGTGAHDLKKNIETLQALAGFDELAAMRASSPTGGALGNVTERELAFLQATLRNIENSQSPDQLRRNLEAFRREVRESWERVNRAYQEEFGEPAGAASADGWGIEEIP
jgi:hypothetical protein